VRRSGRLKVQAVATAQGGAPTRRVITLLRRRGSKSG
jgi:hypothetical protein